MATALNTPELVRASALNLGATTVDYSIDWEINIGSHVGPYSVLVEYSEDGGSYAELTYDVDSSYPLLNTTHEGASYNSTYVYRVSWECAACEGSSSYGTSNTIVAYSESPADTVTLTDEVMDDNVHSGDVVTDSIAMSDVVNQAFAEEATDTVTMSDAVFSSATLKTDYAYYLGDETGAVYTYSEDYGSFNGTAMESYVKFKKTDFSEVAPQAEGRKNSAYRAKLTYVDKGEQFVTFYYSTDGEETWSSVGKTIGTAAAPATTATAYFDFIATSEFFNWKLGCSSTTGTFQWIGLEIEWVLGGEAHP